MSKVIHFFCDPTDQLLKDARMLSDAGKEVTYQLPQSALHLFPKLFESLEKQK
jgi:hypothetical protein